MKKITFLITFLLVAFASSAFAINKPKDICCLTMPQIISNEIQSCANDKHENGQVVADTALISIDIQLIDENEHLVFSAEGTTQNGLSVPIYSGTKRSYVAQAAKDKDGKELLTPGVVEDGFFITVTPTLAKDGKIEVAFAINKSEVTSIDTFKKGDLEIQLPHVITRSLAQTLVFNNDEEISIPFSPITSLKTTSDNHLEPITSQYTLKFVVKKV